MSDTESTTTAPATIPKGNPLPAVLEERAVKLLEFLGAGEPLAKAMRLSDLRLGQFNQIYENGDWSLRIDKAATAFKRYAAHAVLQETVTRFVEGDTEEVVTKSGDVVTRKVKLDAAVAKLVLSGTDPAFATTPAGSGGMGGGTHIHITNNLPAATVANFQLGNEDVVADMLRRSDAKTGHGKVVDITPELPGDEK